MVRPSPIFLGIAAVTVLGGVLCALGTAGLRALLFSHPAIETGGTVLLVLGGWGVSLCLHEFGHAYLALRGGDSSVRAKGYLDLDPRRYTDPLFSLVIPLIFLLIGGIPLPGGAVWINRSMLRSQRAESLVSVAGPAANLILGLLISLVLRFVPMAPALTSALGYLALLQVVAFIINILPIPGLDGWGAIEPWLSYQAREFGAKARPWAPLVLFVLLIGFGQLASLLFGAAQFIDGAVAGPTFGAYASIGSQLFLFWR